MCIKRIQYNLTLCVAYGIEYIRTKKKHIIVICNFDTCSFEGGNTRLRFVPFGTFDSLNIIDGLRLSGTHFSNTFSQAYTCTGTCTVEL